MNSAADQPNAVVAVAAFSPVIGLKYSCGPPPCMTSATVRSARSRASSGCPDARSPSTMRAFVFTHTGPRHMRSGEKSGSPTATVGTAHGGAESPRVDERGHEPVDDPLRKRAR